MPPPPPAGLVVVGRDGLVRVDADGLVRVTDGRTNRCCCGPGCGGLCCPPDEFNATGCGVPRRADGAPGGAPELSVIMLGGGPSGGARYYRRIRDFDGTIYENEWRWGSLNLLVRLPPAQPPFSPCVRDTGLVIAPGGVQADADFAVLSEFDTSGGEAFDEDRVVVPWRAQLTAVADRDEPSGGFAVWSWGFPFGFRVGGVMMDLVQRLSFLNDPREGPIPGTRLIRPGCGCWYGESFTLGLSGSFDSGGGGRTERHEWSVDYTCIARWNLTGCGGG